MCGESVPSVLRKQTAFSWNVGISITCVQYWGIIASWLTVVRVILKEAHLHKRSCSKILFRMYFVTAAVSSGFH